jgi:hypothetical protein
MQNKIILAALLFALSTGSALAQSESAAPVKTADTQVAENASSAAGDKTVAETKSEAGSDSKDVKTTEKTKSDVKAKAKPEKKIKASTSKTTGAASTKSSSNDRLSDAGKFVANGTKRVVATMAGWAVGTPIAVVRMSVHENAEQAKCIPILNESSLPPLVWASRFIFVPTSLFSGAVQAPVYSATNAWRESDENPFSKESFFLGDYDERATQQ